MLEIPLIIMQQLPIKMHCAVPILENSILPLQFSAVCLVIQLKGRENGLFFYFYSEKLPSFTRHEDLAADIWCHR